MWKMIHHGFADDAEQNCGARDGFTAVQEKRRTMKVRNQTYIQKFPVWHCARSTVQPLMLICSTSDKKTQTTYVIFAFVHMQWNACLGLVYSERGRAYPRSPIKHAYSPKICKKILCRGVTIK